MTFNIKSHRILALVLLFLCFSLLTFEVAAYREALQETRGSNQQQVIMGPLLELRASNDNHFTFVAPPPSVVIPSKSQSATIEVTYNGFSSEAEAAFQYAVDIWEAQLTSSVTIRVNATWQSLPSGVLGSAGPYLIANFPDAPQQHVWYPYVIADQFAGVDIDSERPDIEAFFNSDFPNWYFGTDGETPADQYDFVTVVLHELGHGLGFTGSATVSGGQGSWGDKTFGYPYIYDLFVQNGSGESITDTNLFPNPSTELAEQLQGDDLFFNSSNFMRNQGFPPKLYAAAAWQQGSSYAHLDEGEYPASDVNSLMTPILGQAEAIHNPGAITLGIFNDMGWTIDETATATPSNTPLVSSTPTMTGTPTITLTLTATPTVTATLSATATMTGTPTITLTLTATPTGTATLSATPTMTGTPTITLTLTATPTGTATLSATPTMTGTPTITLTATKTPTRTATSTPSKTATYTPSSTPTIPSWKLYLPIIIRAAAASPTATPSLTPSPRATPSPTATSGHPFESQVITLSNQERSKVGCAALTFNEQLRTAAIRHSTDMALNDFFNHTGSDKSLPWDRIEDTGYQYSTAAENIAAGYSSPQAVLKGWMNSQGHRENILNCDLREIGVGYYYLENDTGQINYHHYWTQVFASPLNRKPSKGRAYIPH